LPTEGLGWSGDSGGPAFIDNKIAGVNSGGDCCNYGNEDQFKRLQDSFDWLDDLIKKDNNNVGIEGTLGLVNNSCDKIGR